MKIFAAFFIPFVLVYFFLSYKSKPDTGELLAASLQNEIFIKFDSTKFDSVFVNEFNVLSKNNQNLLELKAGLNNNPKPNFIINFFGNKGMDSLLYYLDASKEHGFDPAVFHNAELRALINQLKSGNFKNVNDSYVSLAKLEILSVSAYTKYCSYLKFGIINPKSVFSGFYINFKQADRVFLVSQLNSVNILDSLSALQNKTAQYKTLQKAFIISKNDSVKKILAVNMERLRWVLPKMMDKYVQVNVPEFKLVYFNGLDTLTSMKVCVGEKREIDYDKKLKVFEKTRDVDDKPSNRETPLLLSNIKSFYANPVWNIPESIAQTEIYTMARKNSGYLKKHNIAVYYKNKLIENPAKIRWYKYDRSKLPFLFVQQSGPDNSLGKLKFVFPNTSSVYLHDTNAREVFKQRYRAVSHGCVRLEKPLQLASLLMADELEFDKVRKELGLKALASPDVDIPVKPLLNKQKEENQKLLPKQFIMRQEIPILITYFTAWAQNQKIQYCKDIYGMDDKLWLAMKKVR